MALLTLLVGVAMVTAAVLVTGGGAAAAGLAYTQTMRVLGTEIVDLPEHGPLDLGISQTATITARDGTQLAEITDAHTGWRRSVPLDQIAPAMVLATMGAEDRRFLSHQGVDPLGLVRALAQNASSDDVASGASTIEMQLVRNLYFPDERSEQTFSRKAKEAISAYQLNQRFTKEELINAYLNVVYYGNRAYGVAAAAERYFGKAPADLTLPEAALLAGLPQSPSAFDPLRRYDLAKDRQEHVLDQMVEGGFITREEANDAKVAQLEFADQAPAPTVAPHWVDYVTEQTRRRFGPEALYTKGLRVETTLDPEIQEIAERVISENEPVRRLGRANNSAMVVIDPRSGQVLAMVGSKNFWDQGIDGQVNVATSGRQPGSSIKPLVFLSGFEGGLNPGIEVLDQTTPFSAPPGQPQYVPANYDNKYYGRTTLRDSLGNSLNVPAVKVLKFVGVSRFLDLARRFGISTLDAWDPRWLSLTLGGGEVSLLELTGAYAGIARGGNVVPIESVHRVEAANGELLYAADNEPRGEQVVDPRTAYQLLHIMGDPGARLVTFGPNTPLNLTRPHMVKTGTTDDYRDTWTVGCVPQVCVGVWMGNTQNQPMVKVSSSLTAGKMWVDMMNALIARYQYPPDPWPRPDGIVVRRIPNVGNTRPGQRDHEEVFLAGQERRYLLEIDWRKPD